MVSSCFARETGAETLVQFCQDVVLFQVIEKVPAYDMLEDLA